MIALLEQNREALVRVCQQFGVERLEVFGSAARGSDFGQESDIDFIVRFSPETNLGPWLSHLQAFQEALEQLLQRPVDLLLDQPIRNPYVALSINKYRTLLYAAA